MVLLGNNCHFIIIHLKVYCEKIAKKFSKFYAQFVGVECDSDSLPSLQKVYGLQAIHPKNTCIKKKKPTVLSVDFHHAHPSLLTCNHSILF